MPDFIIRAYDEIARALAFIFGALGPVDRALPYRWDRVNGEWVVDRRLIVTGR